MAEPGLLELATAEDEVAKRVLYRWTPLVQAASALLTIAALFTPTPVAYVVAIAVLAAQVAAWLLRRYAAGLHAQAEEGRRRSLLISTLGIPQTGLDVAAIRLAFSKRACRAAERLDRSTYWASSQRRGPSRLRESVQESAFLSRALYADAARVATQVLCLVVAALVAIVLIGLVAFDGDTALAVARVLVVGVSTLIAIDLLGIALAWRAASSRSDAVDRRLEALARDDELAPLMAIVTDYAVATQSAPPIPEFVYIRNKDRLDRLWRERQSR